MQSVAEAYAVKEAEVAPFKLRFPQSLSKVVFAFIVFFYGTYVLAQTHPNYTFNLSFSWDEGIPLWPWMYLFYYSAFAIPLVLYRCIKDADQIGKWSAASIIAILIAATCYLALPTREQSSPLISDIQILNLRNFWTLLDLGTGIRNLFPSLHVALSGVAFIAVWKAKHRTLSSGILLGAWFLLICASTLFTHKHHLADVFGGIVCATVAWVTAQKLMTTAYGKYLQNIL
jgi:membrane-associated phospholipid phosphatase